jgi:hypothetical protein
MSMAAANQTPEIETHDFSGCNSALALARESRMSWYERKVHRYEKMRWDQEPNRPVFPFVWGLEHIGGSAKEADPRVFLDRFAEETIARSDEWFAVSPAEDYSLDESILTFSSAIESPWPANNRVYGQLFPVRKGGPAVIVLAQWNARWEEQQSVCRWLNRLGITAIKVSMPYHDRRAIPGHPRADHLVGSNIGLTLQANRQAVLDARRTVRWLEQQGYGPLGILGTSIGSCIGFNTMCHEPALRAGAFLHVSTYFGEVVANGLTTANVWESLQQEITAEEATRYWSPISPYPYIAKMRGGGKKMLAITARYDPTFWPEFTNEFLREALEQGVAIEAMSLRCGHYSLGVAPFKYIAGHRFGRFLSRSLSGREAAERS